MALKLEQILQAIRRQGALDVARIARELNSTPEAVREALRLLEEQDYLETVEMGPPQGLFCRFCPLKNRCGKDTVGIKIYRISAKGLQLLESASGQPKIDR